ncbi:hypothetical protein MG293_001760 [Ovis ammon polii]|uniref:Uncharacterized protein n=1 Tax=Ovis ammon polii TaxID=230172 RepID=A0AAD4YFX1_OVIAM|nr:hypothetical protein MG293_001760 [Ovis ammon polii]
MIGKMRRSQHTYKNLTISSSESEVTQLCPTLVTPRTGAYQARSSMEFPGKSTGDSILHWSLRVLWFYSEEARGIVEKPSLDVTYITLLTFHWTKTPLERTHSPTWMQGGLENSADGWRPFSQHQLHPVEVGGQIGGEHFALI